MEFPMNDFQNESALWDEFLKEWPIERLQRMTLDDYTNSRAKDRFIYWVEFKLDSLGGIRGGSAFKFGVFSRESTESKESTSTHRYSDEYAWYASLGETPEEAFEKVKKQILRVVSFAEASDLEGIEGVEHLGVAFKWKIAFLYQRRDQPCILSIYNPAMLGAYVGTTGQRMADLQRAALERVPKDLGIMEASETIWQEWSAKKLPIWKLSHGTKDFSSAERERFLAECRGVMYGETGIGQGDKFHQIPLGTIFYLCHGNSPQLLGQFTSEVEASEKGEGWVQRKYRVVRDALTKVSYQESSKKWTPQGISTFWKVPPADLPEFEQTLLKPYFGIDLMDLAKMVDSIPDDLTKPAVVSVLFKEEIVNSPINMIYYGPPGTGKTYELGRILKRDYEDAPDLVSDEERRKSAIEREIAPLTWWEGVAAALYQLGGKAKVREITEHPFIQSIVARKGRNRNIAQTLWNALQHHTIADSVTVAVAQRMSPAIFDKGMDSVWRFAGNWQEECADLIETVKCLGGTLESKASVQRYTFVTFHQSYGYEEFVEGLRPVLGDEDASEGGDVRYEIRSGAFKKLCERARKSPDHRFAMIIDEINRGNISKIFGELITLIESDKREGARNALTTELPYSGEPFSVPANVDIIGTMNTADRSLALLDTALRRRFEFVPLLPDTRDVDGAPLAGLPVGSGAWEIHVPKLLEAMNRRIEALFDRDHCIGHAYFTPLRDIASMEERFTVLGEVFQKKILPLLEEYFFEDWDKIRLVLADNQKRPEEQFVLDESKGATELNRLFGTDHSLDEYAVKKRYVLQDTAFGNPGAYMGIYQFLSV